MSIGDDAPIRNLPDRALRQSLMHPANLRAFLGQVIPDLVPRLRIEDAAPVERLFPMDDWREREVDLLFEIPFVTTDEEARSILIAVLIEHQTETDPLMPLRQATSIVQYWDRALKDHLAAGPHVAAFAYAPSWPLSFTPARHPGEAIVG